VYLSQNFPDLPDEVWIVFEYGSEVWFRVERQVHIGNSRLGVVEHEAKELHMLAI